MINSATSLEMTICLFAGIVFVNAEANVLEKNTNDELDGSV